MNVPSIGRQLQQFGNNLANAGTQVFSFGQRLDEAEAQSQYRLARFEAQKQLRNHYDHMRNPTEEDLINAQTPTPDGMGMMAYDASKYDQYGEYFQQEKSKVKDFVLGSITNERAKQAFLENYDNIAAETEGNISRLANARRSDKLSADSDSQIADIISSDRYSYDEKLLQIEDILQDDLKYQVRTDSQIGTKFRAIENQLRNQWIEESLQENVRKGGYDAAIAWIDNPENSLTVSERNAAAFRADTLHDYYDGKNLKENLERLSVRMNYVINDPESGESISDKADLLREEFIDPDDPHTSPGSRHRLSDEINTWEAAQVRASLDNWKAQNSNRLNAWIDDNTENGILLTPDDVKAVIRGWKKEIRTWSDKDSDNYNKDYRAKDITELISHLDKLAEDGAKVAQQLQTARDNQYNTVFQQQRNAARDALSLAMVPSEESILAAHKEGRLSDDFKETWLQEAQDTEEWIRNSQEAEGALSISDRNISFYDTMYKLHSYVKLGTIQSTRAKELLTEKAAQLDVSPGTLQNGLDFVLDPSRADDHIAGAVSDAQDAGLLNDENTERINTAHEQWKEDHPDADDDQQIKAFDSLFQGIVITDGIAKVLKDSGLQKDTKEYGELVSEINRVTEEYGVDIFNIEKELKLNGGTGFSRAEAIQKAIDNKDWEKWKGLAPERFQKVEDALHKMQLDWVNNKYLGEQKVSAVLTKNRVDTNFQSEAIYVDSHGQQIIAIAGRDLEIAIRFDEDKNDEKVFLRHKGKLNDYGQYEEAENWSSAVSFDSDKRDDILRAMRDWE